MIRLKATKDHPDYPEGTVYEAAPAFAASDLYRKRAIEATDEPLTESTEPRKRQYKRRDLTAEK